MQFHTRTATVGAHGRIVLSQPHIDRRHLGVLTDNSVDYPACHMLKKA